MAPRHDDVGEGGSSGHAEGDMSTDWETAIETGDRLGQHRPQPGRAGGRRA